MSATLFPPIPMDTAKAARAVFGRSNFYMATGDRANHLFDGLALDAYSGMYQRPARTLAMLYLVTIFQYLETLPDNLAASALDERLDWKYALHLPLINPRVEAQTLCEFRRYSLVNPSGAQNLQTVLSRLAEVTQPGGKVLVNLETRQVLARVCMFSRLAKIWEVFNQALQGIAAVRPEWLLAISLPHWYERYDQPGRNISLAASSEELAASAQAIGTDGRYLLKVVSESDNLQLAEMAEVLALRRVWEEQFEEVESGIVWRKEACAGCNLRVNI